MNLTSNSKDLDSDSLTKKISFFEKYLALWVILCMITGIILSQIAPIIGQTINSWQFTNISIPIGICLFFMMYPAMLNLQSSEIRKLTKQPKPIILTLISNWFVAPLVGVLLANFFLQDNPQLIFAVILLTASPCTAMVLVWGSMADGNQEQNVITTSLNTITIMIFYAPLVAILTGISNVKIDWTLLLLSALLFIGLPLSLGIISKKTITQTKGETWFTHTYRPFVGKIAILALLSTLIILFSLNGEVLVTNPDKLILVSIPLLLGFAVVVGYNLLITKLLNLQYREAVITVIIGSSSHFEIAIATAVAMFGVGSMAALGTTMGLFWEVPIMLSLVYLSKYLNKHSFWRLSKKDTKEDKAL